MTATIIKIKRAHVISRRGRWGLLKQGYKKASGLYDTKQEAVRAARRLKSEGYDIIIHDKDGTVSRWEKA
ncbi:DUF2188 domain-containing protein [Runella slithyformis]|uniref:DUF2188 domain-containing protein n=1 Tax=Runella slithyformis (strain ATCC 29530 / DSM 19594 / LMG 11500 / NCIMB 11436 / LSU 4) TaxID=761193 RepID=A0A7U3ZI67_RUNSL|nr:hypothetical protein Runsl_1259 [Runella slithyformis DSM 19594]